MQASQGFHGKFAKKKNFFFKVLNLFDYLQLKQLELEKEDIKLKLANMNHDVTCLLAAFNNAKTTGKFELKNLFLKEISADRLNGLGLDSNGSADGSGTAKRVTFADQNGQHGTGNELLLKAELQHSEEIIGALKQELNSLRSQYENLLNGVI